MIAMILVYLVIMIFLVIVPMWKIFTKAGQPGWAVLVPIYNIYVMTLIAKKPAWWLIIILLVPIANFIFLIMLLHAISVNFGKGVGFTLGLIFLSIIFIPILGYGSAQYNPPVEPVAPVYPSQPTM
ncbi:MAG: hypothetical protein A2W93_06565 [Bacteroidetes bacterium GWF2_43_63]|nr:MAG: hypothetical protein A2W94_07970 [Bacteroidetes bacterium GWE2_42_42]OFY53282.1 MAG: hypothetical protein A2W93_06565 [Bacteroidetes bacterium GWF2_43_63]HBG71724.1 signal peptidase I [Bacteroidales bacterium]HCB61611.1 signal peptidase I [Bacteroidales bacterium]HCY22823.1 signal peptidase I [Bacteroidales bacterium]